MTPRSQLVRMPSRPKLELGDRVTAMPWDLAFRAFMLVELEFQVSYKGHILRPYVSDLTPFFVQLCV